MFSYCENNPVNGFDPNGEWVHLAVGAIVGGIIGGISASSSGGNVLAGIIVGALGGALAASGAGVVAQAAGSAALSAVNNATNQLLSKPASDFDFGEVGKEALIGAAAGVAGGNGASYGNAKSIMTSGKQAIKHIGRNIKHGKSAFKPLKTYYRSAHNGSGKFVITALGKSLGIGTATSHFLSRRFG